MGKIENDELRKIKNAHFLRAFEHVASVLQLSQGELAESIGSKSSYISNFRKGLRPVPDETINGLINISASKPGLQIFSEYLYGNSEIMLLANVTDEEMASAKMRSGNPDYEVLHKRDVESSRLQKVTQRSNDIQMAVLGHIAEEPKVTEGIAADEDPRSYLPAWADTLLGILSKQIAENEVLHSELKQSISDLHTMQHQLSELLSKQK